MTPNSDKNTLENESCSGIARVNLTAVVAAIGTDTFMPALYSAILDLVNADHVTLFVFDSTFVPYFGGGFSKDQSALTKKISGIYRKSLYYQFDPAGDYIGDYIEEGAGSDMTAPLVQQLHAKDITNDAYRKEIYEDHGLLDRLSLVDHLKQKWFILNLYRDEASGYFSSADVGAVRAEAVFLAACVKKHLSASKPEAWINQTVLPVGQLETLVASLPASLSQREMEVCARAMQGLTREAIALDLAVSQPTVATFMRRAYSKLNISSLNELFALCLTYNKAS